MALNLTKTFTLKSNAHADVRKAIKRGECAEGDFTVVALSGGFRIVSTAEAAPFRSAEWPQPVAEEATSPAGWRAPEAILGRWPTAAVPGLDRTTDAHAAAEAAEIVAPTAEAMASALAADRDAAAELEEARRELLTDPQVRIGSAVMADWEAERAAIARDVTPGLARLRADDNAEAIRAAVVADQEKAIAEADARAVTVVTLDESNGTVLAAPLTSRKAKVERAKQERATKARRVERAIAKLDEPKAASEAPKAATPKSAGLSAGAAQILRALFQIAGDGGWIDQKAIPHGLSVKAAPGYLSGLQKRGLVELRSDKGGKFSARMTILGQEAGR